MSSEGSVTHWLHQLQAGDAAGAQQLWQRYFHRLVGLARDRLHGARRAADEEDVALSAFATFCRRAEQGLFPQLSDRGDLWRLLFTITLNKAKRLVRDEHRLKRGGGKVRGDSALRGTDASAETPAGFDQLAGDEPTPEFAAEVAEQFRRLLDCLDGEELRGIALAKLEGETTEAIAARLGVAPRTVERKLRVIRHRWG